MLNLSYNLSSTLKSSLQKIEFFRRQILLTPLSPRSELRLRWEAMLDRLYWSLTLANNPLSKTEMAKLLASLGKKKLSSAELEVINYKKALNYINEEWLVSEKTVTPKTILTLHEIACQPTIGKSFGNLFRLSEEPLKKFLGYLQTGTENPVIKAAISQIQLIYLKPFSDGNGRVSRLLALLFLYKEGYDFRGLLALEEYFRRDLVALKQATQSASQDKNLTSWLEYFAKGIVVQLQKASEQIKSPKYKTDLSVSFWNLNNRQKIILSQLENPEVKITNKEVQKMFNVSQITASRYLSRLANLGLLLSHGKGRSIFYTRA